MGNESELAPATDPSPPKVSIEADASLMNRGTMRNFSYLVAGGLLLIGVGVLLVQRLGRVDAYSVAAASTALVGREYFDGFFDCALPGTRSTELNAKSVQAGLSRLGDRDGKNYGLALTKCLPQMHALTQGVSRLHTPAAVKDQQLGLVMATEELASANTRYLYYLNDGIEAYDASTAEPLQWRIGAAWAGYRSAEAKLVQAMNDRP
jgi:hypothetical protein